MEIHPETSQASKNRFHSDIHVAIDVCIVVLLYISPEQVDGIGRDKY